MERNNRFIDRWRLVAGVSAVALALVVWIIGGSGGRRTVESDLHYDGTPIGEFHCVPSGPGQHPAVIMLHGAAVRPADIAQFHSMCAQLAEHGYYAEFVEYYDAAEYSDLAMDEDATFSAWFGAIHAAVDALDKNPAVDPKRIGVMGFSQGAYLAIGAGALFPDQIAAVVDYYGGLIPPLRDRVKLMPPTLILHGERDSMIPLSEGTDLDRVLTGANRPHEIHIYPDAEHGFNFRADGDRYNKDVADDAWNRALEFLNKTLRQ